MNQTHQNRSNDRDENDRERVGNITIADILIGDFDDDDSIGEENTLSSSQSFIMQKDEVQSVDNITSRLPDTVFYKIYSFLNIEDVKSCRLACRRFNATILSSGLLTHRSKFTYDGRHDDVNGLKCKAYFIKANTNPIIQELEKLLSSSIDNQGEQHQTTNSGMSYWSHLHLNRANYNQLSWISTSYTSTITTLTVTNCSLSWFHILRIFSEFQNLITFSDTLDMFFWDYATFNVGIHDNESILENSKYKELEAEGLLSLDHLNNLRHVAIRRCQLQDCVLYLKIFLLKCNQLKTLDITTDQAVSPRPFTEFYNYLGQIISANASTLQNLWFPYKSIYPAIEFHVLDPNNPFNIFLNYAFENEWATRIKPTSLVNLTIQYPSIQLEETLFQQKLLPFLVAWNNYSASTLKSLSLNYVYLEPGKEHILVDCLPSSIQRKWFGVWLLDSDGLPFIEDIQNQIKLMNIQIWRPISTEIKNILMLDDEDDDDDEDEDNDATNVWGSQTNNPKFPLVKELQFFNKSITFQDYNLKLIIANFCNLTHLNMVDYNTRVDRIHSSESPATIEDDDLQKIFKCLPNLEFLQLIGNMTYLTDTGLTGISSKGIKRMLKTDVFEKLEKDIVGLSFSALKKLRTVMFRGVGIKITDVTAHFGFSNSTSLKRLHIYGSHQITRTGRSILSQKFPSSKGYDVQV